MTSQALASCSDGTTISALRTIAAAGPVGEQSLNVISLEALKASLGDRWAVKQEQVWNQVERFLRHELRAEDLVLRLDDVNVLILQPGRPRFAAQTRCVRAAGDLMRFFLGDVPDSSVSVRVVDAINGGEVLCSPLPQSQLAAALMTQNPGLWTVQAACRLPILTRMERDLAIDLQLSPMLGIQLGRGGGAYAVETALTDMQTGAALGPQDRSLLLSSNLATVDTKVLSTAFARRRELPLSSAPLIVPVSAVTLAGSSGRYALLQEVHKLSLAERQSFIWEIVDLEPGIPAGRLADLVATARPHCRGVMCLIEPSAANARKLKAAGATLSVAPERETPLTEYGLLKLEHAVSAAAKCVHAVLYHRLAPELLPVAAFIGITHCTVADPAQTVHFSVP